MAFRSALLLAIMGAAAADPLAEHVILFGWDGLAARWALGPHMNVPNLRRLIAEGSSSLFARNVMPTITLPNFGSILSGAGPEEHGILSNSWNLNSAYLPSVLSPTDVTAQQIYTGDVSQFPGGSVDDGSGYPLFKGPGDNVRFPTIFKAVKETGGTTGMFFSWANLLRLVDDGDVDVMSFGNCSTYQGAPAFAETDSWHPGTCNYSAPGPTALEDDFSRTRVDPNCTVSSQRDCVEPWPSQFYDTLTRTCTGQCNSREAPNDRGACSACFAVKDRQNADKVVGLLQQDKLPSFTFLYMGQTDEYGHYFAWNSSEYRKSIERVDVHLGRLMDAIKAHSPKTLLLLTADHGGPRGWNPNNDVFHYSCTGVTPMVGTVPWIAHMPSVVKAGHVIDHVKSRLRHYDMAATVLFALGVDRPAVWTSNVISEIFASGSSSGGGGGGGSSAGGDGSSKGANSSGVNSTALADQRVSYATLVAFVLLSSVIGCAAGVLIGKGARTTAQSTSYEHPPAGVELMHPRDETPPATVTPGHATKQQPGYAKMEHI